MKNKMIIIAQAVFLLGVLLAVYFAYPRTSLDVNGGIASFSSINANVIIISDNENFSSPRYLEVEKGKNLLLKLKPGIYYWKASNNIIEGIESKFEIESEVGMKIDNNEDELVNIGNVKLNVTKNKEGIIVGHVILEPDESEKIENESEFVGRQA